jgi:hypothetical protein
MKAKLDFITNSSSTSFTCWGFYKDIDKILKDESLMKRLYEYYLKNTKNEEVMSFEDFKDTDNKYDLVELVSSWTKLEECSLGQEGDYFMIGIHPSKMKNEQTLKQFKDEIASALNKVGFELTEKDIGFLNESWYDG